MIQKAHDSNGKTEIILITHITTESKMNEAIKQIESLDYVNDQIVRIRLEELN